jgi:hypothetical protein
LHGRLGRWLGATFEILFALACALGLSRLIVTAVTEYAARNPAVRPALAVVRGIVRIAVAVLAAIMVLEALGVPVARCSRRSGSDRSPSRWRCRRRSPTSSPASTCSPIGPSAPGLHQDAGGRRGLRRDHRLAFVAPADPAPTTSSSFRT